MGECKCGLRVSLVGDGCEVCNPAVALDYANDRIKELEAELAKANGLLDEVTMVAVHWVGYTGSERVMFVRNILAKRKGGG